MALITTSYLKSCEDENRRGGVKAIYIANSTQITSFTPDTTNHEYTAVTMDGTAEWYKYEFERYEAEASFEDSNENGSSTVTTTINLFLPKMEKVKADALEKLRKSCEVTVIVQDFNLNSFLYGWDEFIGADGALRPMVNGGTGRALSDPNRYDMTITGMQTELPRQFTGVITTPEGVVNLSD